MPTTIIRCNPIILDGARGALRVPTRPPEYRFDGFDTKFDYETLFYDAFYSAQGDQIIAVAPPFLNLLPMIERASCTAVPSRRQCAFQIKNMDRHAQIWISVPSGTERIVLDCELGSFDIAPQRNLSRLFADKRVLFTQSQNNLLPWIQDWIRYNRDIHGANAVLLYDNASTAYPTMVLAEAIGGISGIEQSCIVEWPFKFGPQGIDAKRFWDSDYGQHGIMEHSRRLFLEEARSAQNSDIDELIVSADGRSVFEAAERSWTGIVRYGGVWAMSFDELNRTTTDEQPVRHREFDHYRRTTWSERWLGIGAYRHPCPAKWTVVPRRCPQDAQWRPHRIKGWWASRLKTDAFSYRHFREISTGWKYNRSVRDKFDVKRHARDQLMISHYDRVQWNV